MQPSPTEALRAALAAARHVVAGVGADQWSAPTPCTEWNVAELTDHLVGGNRLFAAAVGGGQAAPAPSRASSDDRLAAYDSAADELVAAFSADDALERIVTVPFGTVPGAVALHLRLTELLVHGWDLARATGQGIEAPDALVEQELAFTRRALDDVPADRSPFGPPQTVEPTAPPLDQLVALLGRSLDA